ncbi:MAG: DUF86 domain-containing protein [Candidatus Aminicenantaceae bacterium]
MDRERVLSRIDELDGYLKELDIIMPTDFRAYKVIEKKRSCERLLQIAIEAIINICALMVTGLRLGIPSEEDDIFDKLEQSKIITPAMKETLKRMKGFRNILVHEYGHIDDDLVYGILKNNIKDFRAFKKEILDALKRV